MSDMQMREKTIMPIYVLLLYCCNYIVHIIIILYSNMQVMIIYQKLYKAAGEINSVSKPCKYVCVLASVSIVIQTAAKIVYTNKNMFDTN